jgi:hypothetical protein
MNNDLKLYNAVEGGNEITVREWAVNSIPTNLYVEGTSVSNAMRDKECKLTWKGINDIVKVTVCSVTITASRWTEKGQRSDVILTYFPSNLDTEKITLTGNATSLFKFYKIVQNEETGEETEEKITTTSWDLPRATNNNAWHTLLEKRIIGEKKMFVADIYNSGQGSDVVWNYPIYKVVENEYVETSGQTNHLNVTVKSHLNYWTGEEKSLYYLYDISYSTDGIPLDSSTGSWRIHSSSQDKTNYQKPEWGFIPKIQEKIGQFWKNSLNYNTIRSIVTSP